MSAIKAGVHHAYNLSALSTLSITQWSLKKRLVASYIIAWVFGAVLTYGSYGGIALLIINVHIVFSMMLFFGHIQPEIEYWLFIRKLEKEQAKKEGGA